jgi:hypothetical protein
MVAQHYLIILLPQKSKVDKLCYEFWEDENINEFTAACTTLQILNFFKNNKLSEDILTDSFADFTLDLDLNELLINFMSINHIAKTLLKPYKVEGDVIEEILENGCEYGVSIIDCRDTDNIRYCLCIASYDDWDEVKYKILNIFEYLQPFSDEYREQLSNKHLTEEEYNDIISGNNLAIKMSEDFETIPEDEVMELFPKLFE